MINSLELTESFRYHQNDQPLLVSSKVLRNYGASQIDLSFIKFNQFGQQEIFVIELKQSSIGVRSSFVFKRMQREKKIIILLKQFFYNESISFYYSFQKSAFDHEGLY